MSAPSPTTITAVEQPQPVAEPPPAPTVEKAVVTDADQDVDDKAPPASATEPTPEQKAAEEAAIKEAQQFAMSRMRFLIHDVASEAAVRATSLLETNTAMRVLVNAHFVRERDLHSRQEAKEASAAERLKNQSTSAAELSKKGMKKLAAKKAAAEAAAETPAASAAGPDQQRQRVFSRPLILHTMQKADGSWLATRQLDINPSIPADKLTREQWDDLDLAGKNVLDTTAFYASTGFAGLALIVDALERTERQMVCRHITFARVAHKVATADIHRIKDPQKRLAALADVTKLLPILTSIGVEDLEGKKILLYRERARLAQTGAPVGTLMDESKLVTSFTKTDDRELLELKRDKQLMENDAQHVLDELRRESAAYQNYAVSRSAISLLIAAMRSKPAILEHVELQVKSGGKEPTLVSFLCKSNAIDTSDLPISYASAAQLRAGLERARAEKNDADVERHEKILAKLLQEAKRPSTTRFAADGKTPLEVGADCVVFEIVNQCTGLAMPITTTHLGTFPDVLSMRPQFAAAGELAKRMKENMSTVAKHTEVEPKLADFDDETMAYEIEALVGEMSKRKNMSKSDWSAAKEKIMKAFEEAAAKAEAADEMAATQNDDDDDDDDKEEAK